MPCGGQGLTCAAGGVGSSSCLQRVVVEIFLFKRARLRSFQDAVTGPLADRGIKLLRLAGSKDLTLASHEAQRPTIIIAPKRRLP